MTSLFKRGGTADVIDLTVEQDAYVEAIEVPTGTVVVRQGEAAHAFYVVLSGEFTVFLETAPRPVAVRTLHAGDCFGEAGMLLGGRHQATVRAATDGELVVLGQFELESIVSEAVVRGIDLPTAALAYATALEWEASVSA